MSCLDLFAVGMDRVVLTNISYHLLAPKLMQIMIFFFLLNCSKH